MSEQTSQEPTMEEILASIRRIISEDDAPPAETGDSEPVAPVAAAPPPVAAVPEPAPEPEPEPVAVIPPPAPEPVVAVAPEPEEEELELTEKVETLGDLDIFSPEAAVQAAPAAPPPTAAPAPVETLVSSAAASAAASAFGQLSAAMLMPKGDRTLEDVVRELLRPMLQQWLDANLPTIVQQAVEAEVDRIARGRVR
jgi:cell pole-organizing protein PopZ